MAIEDIPPVTDRMCCLSRLPHRSLSIWMCCVSDEAFVARHMPDLGYDQKDFTAFTWKLKNWRKLEKKLTSPEFECGGHKWSVHYVQCIPYVLSYYVITGAYYCFPSGTPMPPLMTQYQFTLIMLNPRSHRKAGTLAPSLPLSSQIPTIPLFTPSAVSAVWWDLSHLLISPTDAHHRFIAEECDWGFTRFSELRKLLSVLETQSRPTIEDEAADVTVFVRVLEDPTGVLWHNFVKWASRLSLPSLDWGDYSYDSKKETGYVGLKNQGATCYMNSLLQSLYCTRYFRRVSMSFCGSHLIDITLLTCAQGCASNTNRRR